jgi:hypothetical protein
LTFCVGKYLSHASAGHKCLTGRNALSPLLFNIALEHAIKNGNGKKEGVEMNVFFTKCLNEQVSLTAW